jgi:hypothetical protein
VRTVVQPIPGYQLRWSEVDDETDDQDDPRRTGVPPHWLVAPGLWLALGATAGWLLRYVMV